MARLSVLLAANWGLGERLLAALLDCPEVSLLGVVTRAQTGGEDPWADSVRRCAMAAGLSVWDETVLPPLELGALVRSLGADVLWLHAYMHRLPREAYTAPRRGTVNVHASLLPAYRGPSPQQWVLRNREPLTGLTSHYVDEGFDSGPIIHQEQVPLHGDETEENLLDKLKGAAAPLVRMTIRNILDPGFHPARQDASRVTYAPRINEVEP
jgi:methionyl-tRNA formyltransferase